MKVLLLGVGLQGKAALYDMVQNKEFNEIIVADYDIKSLGQYLKNKNYKNVTSYFFDVNSQENINELFNLEPDIVIDLLPVHFIDKIASTAVKFGVNLVNTCYASNFIKGLNKEVERKEMTILPEFGFDPGIDLVILGEARKNLDKIEVIHSYGSGIPELSARDNPLNYKFTWTFEGVLRSYFRAGKLIKEGKIQEIKENEMFDPKNIHSVEIEGVGDLEAFPNGDALKYLELIGINNGSKEYNTLQSVARFTMRWPGHSEFWKKLVDLHLLDDEPIEINGMEINRRKFLAKIIEPHIQLQPNERDLAILLIELIGYRNGEKRRVTYQMVDKRDLETGFTAMNRTVGYTASIGAHLLANKIVVKKGVLSPVMDIPFEIFNNELAKRGIIITKKEEKM
ncbi:MAG TPA: saccharopine dehydrogenase C-terminal domain-containing protein [candidate division Zixibacteria bacterium]|nr:saccharopine dehydrogenase C-terminal domain-containing protein [candidate division Zixibacteria bacterium]